MASSSSGSCNPGDPALINSIVDHLKSQGLFDQFRRDCLGDVDTKPAYQNLRSRVETYVSNFLGNQKWDPSLNKNQLRNNLRQQINQSGILSSGIDRVIHQVVEPKIQHVFRPQIEKVVHDHVAREEEKKKWEEERRRAEELIKTRPEPPPIKTEPSRSAKQDSPHAKPFGSLPIDLPIPISSPKTEFPSSTKTGREPASGEKPGKRPLDSSRQGKGELSKKRSANETSSQGDNKTREGKEGKIHSPERKKVVLDQKGSSVGENKKTDPRLESARTVQESRSPVSSGQRMETESKDPKPSAPSQTVPGQAGEMKKAASSFEHKSSDKAAKTKPEPSRVGESGEKSQTKEKSDSSSKPEKHNKPTKPPKASRSEDSAKLAKVPRKDDSPKPEKKKEDSQRNPKTSKSEDSGKPYKIPKKDDASKSYKIPKTEDSSKMHRRDDSPKHSKTAKTDDPSKVSKLTKSEDSGRSPKVYKSDDPSRSSSKVPRKEDTLKTAKVTKSDPAKSSKVSRTEMSKSADYKGKSAKLGDSKVQGDVRYKSSSKSAPTEESKIKKEVVSATSKSLEEKKHKEKEKEDTSKAREDKRSKEREESEKRREEKKLKEKDITPKIVEEKKDDKEATSKMITEKVMKDGEAEPPSSKSKKYSTHEKKSDHKAVSSRQPGDEDLDNLSVSSVHTSDLSSFDEEISSVSSSEIEDELSQQEGKDRSKTDTEGSSMQTDSEDTSRPGSKSSGWEGASPGAAEGRTSRRRKQVSYRKMLSGQYSDSEEEETREERRARIAKEKEERLLRRQKARAERAEKRQHQGPGTEQATADKRSTELQEESPSTKESPQDRRKKVMEQRKQSLKEAKKEQKVLEKKRALRRRLTVNPKYMSEDFASLDFHIAGARESVVAVEGQEPVVVEPETAAKKTEDASPAVPPVIQETTEEATSKLAHVKRVPTPTNVPAKPRPRRRCSAKIQVELEKRQVQLGCYSYSFSLPKPSTANFLLCTTASIPEVLQNSQPNKPKKRRASNVGAGSAPARPGSAQGRGRRRGSTASDKQDKGYDTSPAPLTPSPPPPRPDSAQGKRRKKSSDDTTEGPPSTSLDTTTKYVVLPSPKAANIAGKSSAEDKEKDDVVEKAAQIGTDDCVKAHKVQKEIEKPSTTVSQEEKTEVTRVDNSVEVDVTGQKTEVVDTQERSIALPKDKCTASVVEAENATAKKTVASASDTNARSSVAVSKGAKETDKSVGKTEDTTSNKTCEIAETKDTTTDDHKGKEETGIKGAVESKKDEDSQETKEKLSEPSRLMEKRVANTQPEGDDKVSSLPSEDTREDTKPQSATSEEKATDKPKAQPPMSSSLVEEYEEPRTPPTPTQDEQFEYQPLNTETAYSIPIVALQPSAAEPADQTSGAPDAAGPSSKEEEPREYSEGEVCSSDDDDAGDETKRKRSDSPASQSSSSSRSHDKEGDQKGDKKSWGKTTRETRERGVEPQSTQKSTPSESARQQASEIRGGKRDDGSRRAKRGRTPSPPRAYRRSPSSPRRRRSPSPLAGGSREVKGGRSRRNSSPQSRRSTRRSVDEDAPISKRPRRI